MRINLNKATTTRKAFAQNRSMVDEEFYPELFTSNLMKIAVNYIQVASIIIKFNNEWPETVRYFSTVLVTDLGSKLYWDYQ